MKQGPINDNVMVMDQNAGEEQLDVFAGEEGYPPIDEEETLP